MEYDRLEQILAIAQARIRRAYLDAIASLQKAVASEQIGRLLASRNIDEVQASINLTANNIASSFAAAYLLAASDVMKFISKSTGTAISFNFTAIPPTAALIRSFTAIQMQAVRTALIEGARFGVGTQEQMRLLQHSLGLTPGQIRAVASYRRLLQQGSLEALRRELRDTRFDSTVRRAVASADGLSQAQIDRMTERYYRRALAYRALVIANTEALRAVHQGSDAAFAQAIEQGVIDPGLTQTWFTVGDGRVRHPSHTAMNGQVRPFGQPFLSGLGNSLMYPGDPSAPAEDAINCRCTKISKFHKKTGIASS